jgi:hypothetical protein
MAPEHRDWTVPAPFRALLWWPPIAFVVALLDPSAAAGTIAAVGAVLAVLGVVGATVGGALARRLGRAAGEVPEASVVDPVPVGAGSAPQQRAA